jgi:hypothetical protein
MTQQEKLKQPGEKSLKELEYSASRYRSGSDFVLAC